MFKKLIGGRSNVVEFTKDSVNVSNASQGTMGSFDDKRTSKRCNMCGTIWTYTRKDLRDQNEKIDLARGKLISARMQKLFGSPALADVINESAREMLDSVIDYSKCPTCGSRDCTDISKKESQDTTELLRA